MARAAKKDPKLEQLDEIAAAKKEGKSDFSISSPDDEVLAAAFEIKTLTKLRVSIGYDKKDKRLPDGIEKLTELKDLNIEGCELTEFPAGICKLTKLEDLTAYHNQFEEIPDEIGALVALKDLSLWKNNLTSLPAGIGKLKNLKKLSIKWNAITSLPKEIGGLVSLEELDAEDNKLTDLPAEFGNLRKLRELKLSDNAFAKFPLALTDLEALEMLLVGGNEITELPDAIVKMKKLRELNIRKNKLRALPEALFKTNVSMLQLADNQLKDIPKSIGGMKSLLGILVTGNPLSMPEPVIEGGKDAIFEHLGLSMPLEMSGDLPADDVVKAVLKKKKERIEQFVRETKRKLTDEKMRDQVVAFVTGKQSRVPPARIKDHYSFGHISEALSPYAEWDFVDRRILRFITQSAWWFLQPGHGYPTGYHDELFGWLKKQLAEEKDPELFGKIAKEIVANGIDEGELARQALREMNETEVLRPDDKQPTSFGRWLLQRVKNPAQLEVLMELAKDRSGPRTALTNLLVAHDPATFEKAAPSLLAIEPDSDGEIHIPYESLRTVCAKNPGPFEALLLDGIKRTDCLPCKAEGLRILAESYAKKHEQAALDGAIAVLKEVSERKNKKERYDFPWTGGERWGDGTPQYIGWMLDRFGERVHKQVFEFAENTKVFDLDVAEVVARKIGQAGIDILGEGLSMKIEDDGIAAHYRRMFTLLAPLDWSKFHDKAWEVATNEHRKVRETACLALSRLGAKAVLPKAKALVDAKKGHEREAGVMILGLLGTPESRKILEGIVDTETSDDARDLIVGSLCEKPQKIDVAEAERRVEAAKERGKLSRPVAKWLDEKKLPAPSWAGGKKKKLSADAIRWLLHRQTRRSEIEIDPEARDVFDLIDRESAEALGDKLLALVMKNGGPSAKTRFALSVIGRLGGDGVIPALEEVAIEKHNENAVATIGLLGTMEAARSLDRIAKVFRVKYPNVREVAQEGFARIADSLGKTPFELADAMLPDFGFKKLTQPAKAGKRKLSLAIGAADRKPVFLDEDGEPMKAPPKELGAKEKTAFKELGASMRTAAKQLAGSLEYYLIVGRRWSGADWSAFFLEKALPHAFARGLVWGLYKGRTLQKAFRVGADGMPSETVGKDATVGLVHPLELSEKDRETWQKAATSDGATPAFEQMTRPVYAVAPEDRAKKLSYLFEGKEVAAATLKGRAERLGWRRGSVNDGGEVSAHKKTYTTDVIDAFITHEGVGVQTFDYDSEATLQRFFFVKSGSVVTGSYTYDEPRDESDARLIALGDVPPIVYSETVADLHTMAGTKKKAGEEEDDDGE